MTFEDKFMEVQVGMISLAMEYVQNQAEKVYRITFQHSVDFHRVFFAYMSIEIDFSGCSNGRQKICGLLAKN